MLWPPAQHVSTIVPTTASEADVVTLPWLLVDPEGFSHWLLLLPVMEMLAMWKNMAHTYTQNTHHHPPPLLSTGKTWPIASWQRNPGNVTCWLFVHCNAEKSRTRVKSQQTDWHCYTKHFCIPDTCHAVSLMDIWSSVECALTHSSSTWLCFPLACLSSQCRCHVCRALSLPLPAQ